MKDGKRNGKNPTTAETELGLQLPGMPSHMELNGFM